MKGVTLPAVACVMVLLLVASSFPASRGVASGLAARETLYGDAAAGWGRSSTTVTSPGPTLVYTATTELTLDLKSADGDFHNWYLDLDHSGTLTRDDPVSPDFYISTTSTLTLWGVGTFTYRCNYHALAMFGTLVVLPFSLNDFPLPFIYAGVINTSMVMGVSVPHNGLGGASTIDVVGSAVLGVYLGRKSTSGVLFSRLDTEVATGSAPPYRITWQGNIITLGGRGVNMVSNAVNCFLSTRFACAGDGSGRGIYNQDSMRNYVRCTPTTLPACADTKDYALVSIYHDLGALGSFNRYILKIAGLSGFATRITTSLVGLAALPMCGTGIVVELVDLRSDGVYDTYQVIDGSGGFICGMPLPALLPPF